VAVTLIPGVVLLLLEEARARSHEAVLSSVSLFPLGGQGKQQRAAVFEAVPTAREQRSD